MTHDTRVSLLRYASAIITGFGLLFFLSLLAPFSGLMNLFIKLAFMSFEGAQVTTNDTAHLLTVISGSMLTGWGLMFWLVTTRVYAKIPKLGKPIMLQSIGVWFLLDSLGSVGVGAWFNVILNAGFLILIAGPILWPGPKTHRYSAATRLGSSMDLR